MNGKGDTYRPVNQRVYDDSYDRIFKKGKYAPEQTPVSDQAPQASRRCSVCDDPIGPDDEYCGFCD